MHYWPFLVAAYGITVVALGGMLFLSLGRLRRLERQLEEKR